MRHSKQNKNRISAKISSTVRKSSNRSPVLEVLLQPWFLDVETAQTVQKMIPRKFFSRMRWFFDDFGCVRCGKRNLEYAGSGFCVNCHARVARYILESMKRRSRLLRDDSKASNSVRNYLKRAEIARGILGDLAAGGL